MHSEGDAVGGGIPANTAHFGEPARDGHVRGEDIDRVAVENVPEFESAGRALDAGDLDVQGLRETAKPVDVLGPTRLLVLVDAIGVLVERASEPEHVAFAPRCADGPLDGVDGEQDIDGHVGRGVGVQRASHPIDLAVGDPDRTAEPRDARPVDDACVDQCESATMHHSRRDAA